MTAYRLRVRCYRGPVVLGVIALHGLTTINAAKTMAREWALALQHPVKDWNVEVIDESGVRQWEIRTETVERSERDQVGLLG